VAQLGQKGNVPLLVAHPGIDALGAELIHKFQLIGSASGAMCTDNLG
jgi:hypothetical protein